jgi:hypothetical protein
MAVNKLQDGPPNSRIALRATRINCKKNVSNGNTYPPSELLMETLTLKTTMHHKYNLT